MGLTAGIVGLPNVGKSTLFNAITKKNILAANYPFATIDPNVGIVTVPDKRLEQLETIYTPDKTMPTAFEFTDIAGLVKGASKGEGLGNKFLSHIREVDAICEVVRCFENIDITHVEGEVDPIRDIEIIDVELILSDIEVIENRISKIAKKARTTKDKEALKELVLLEKLNDYLLKDIPVRRGDFTDDELLVIKGFQLLTSKPIIYMANIDENEIASEENQFVKKVREYASKENAEVITVCAKIESELSELNEDDKMEFLEDLGIKESGLNKLINATYKLLGLATYFTAGPKEVRAWTFKIGMTAPNCAGIIHSDFERGFIRAEVTDFNDLITLGSEKAVKEAGKMRLEGKEYLMKDGDVCHFRFNV